MYKVLILLFLYLIVAGSSGAQVQTDLRMRGFTGGNSMDRKNSNESIGASCTAKSVADETYSCWTGAYYNFFAPLTAEEEDENKIGPYTFLLRQNLPNPFNPATRIDYSLAENTHVEISVYNLLGQEVDNLVDEKKTAGEHSVVWYGTDENAYAVEPGEYFCRIKAGDFVSTKKMVMQK